ncbi:class I SAM-dependent methyltransferase [Candidatus Woesearchaeota archaeon]|nr:class I SAM-dependent methyltransferase [Candidatus Woesearchaeota archaeon]
MAKKSPEDPEHVKNLLYRAKNLIGDNVLIFGASNDVLIKDILNYCKKIVLIDIRQESLDKFKGMYPLVELKLVKEGREFEDFSNMFNSIIFYDTLHHVKNKDKKIKECYDILKENGFIILYEPNIYSKLIKEYDQFGKLKNSIYKYQLFKILKKNGFKVRLLSSEELLSRKRMLKKFVIYMQKSFFDPRYRILMIAKKRV